MTAKTPRPTAAKTKPKPAAKQTAPKPAKQAPAAPPEATASATETPAAVKGWPAGTVERAAALRAEGMSWKDIGAKLGVKSTGLLSKRVREQASG